MFAVVLSNCGSVPKRPHGEVCAISKTPIACACVDSETGDPTRVIPIDQCAGYVTISNSYYQQLEDWIQELIKKVRGFPRHKAEALRQVNEIHHSVESAKEYTKTLQ